MKAWQREEQWMEQASIALSQTDQKENWMKYLHAGEKSDEKLFSDWESAVPGSLAPCHLVIAAIACMENKGYDVREAEKLIDAGLEAAQKKDAIKLQQITAQIYHTLNHAPKDGKSPYWQYEIFQSWQEIEKAVCFEPARIIDVKTEVYAEKVKAGWLGQLIGGALGTQIEGYTTKQIRARFGEIHDYVRDPETYNDDITYEIAFLAAFEKTGYAVSSQDIAMQWLGLVPDGYSAEEVALYNLRRGVFPPESGTTLNYYSDWIGAQMRTMVHGMVAPGNPFLAAQLAVKDSVISHSNSGMLGGMYNAMLISLCFVENDVRAVLQKTADMLPAKSEYASIVNFTMKTCKKQKGWEEAWQICRQKLHTYHWIHAYPNICAQMIALWYGESDFETTAHIIAMCGEDADCTAAPALNALGVMHGMKAISKKWLEPLGEMVHTFMREPQQISVQNLCDWTVSATILADEKQNQSMKTAPK